MRAIGDQKPGAPQEVKRRTREPKKVKHKGAMGDTGQSRVSGAGLFPFDFCMRCRCYSSWHMKMPKAVLLPCTTPTCSCDGGQSKGRTVNDRLKSPMNHSGQVRTDQIQPRTPMDYLTVCTSSH